MKAVRQSSKCNDNHQTVWAKKGSVGLCVGVLTWALCTALGPGAWSSPVEAAVDILTSRNDAARTGANVQETILTTYNVSSERFGLRFAYGVEGNIYGQPLVVNGIRTALG